MEAGGFMNINKKPTIFLFFYVIVYKNFKSFFRIFTVSTNSILAGRRI